ncbi:uncharacterized protein LOC111892194 isoform X2 [Lactuca sativa]|uniref:uncharacterized protein LOC111892194 isoform X2 n=1 Tax=Lactuca sativa TaxID=4236 RepID=UPI000CD89294|nr:uncharacterized protein LOC111892194 isoform X2 [Lactuca sativa]
MMKPLPNVLTAYSLIIQEEQQRCINNHSQINLDSIAMHVSSDVQHTKKQLVCNHCKKNGHTKSQCYILIIFPSNFKFTKTKKEESKSMAQNVTVKPDIGITEVKYNHLLHLLNASYIASSSTSQVNNSVKIDAMEKEGPFDEE